MPPASPAPGWSSGLVCTDRVATRRGSPGPGERRAGTYDLPLRAATGWVRVGTPDYLPSCNSAKMARMPDPAQNLSAEHRALPGRGRTAVVMGASSGIGAATAARLAAEGFDVDRK